MTQWLKYGSFSLGLLFIASLLYLISATVEPVYPLLTQRYTQLLEQKDHIEFLTIGSSHSVAIDFEAMGIQGYHLWDFGEDLFESEYKTRYILNQLPQLKVVFLTLPYPIFVHDNAHSELGAMYNNRAKLHFISAEFDVIHGDLNSLFKGKLAPIARYDHWVFLPKHVFLNQDEITPVIETVSIEHLGTDGNMRGEVAGFTDAEQLHEVAIEKLQNHLRYVAKTQALEAHIQEKTRTALIQLVELLKKRNIQLITYTPPFYESYLEHFPLQLHQSFQENLQILVRDHGLQHIDFSRSANFIHRPIYFQDGNHLSSDGARAFSKQFAAHLKANKLIP
ncbi:MAG: hypothetical protein ACPGJS_02785 [Flammeovirgaceae bacterium]